VAAGALMHTNAREEPSETCGPAIIACDAPPSSREPGWVPARRVRHKQAGAEGAGNCKPRCRPHRRARQFDDAWAFLACNCSRHLCGGSTCDWGCGKQPAACGAWRWRWPTPDIAARTGCRAGLLPVPAETHCRQRSRAVLKWQRQQVHPSRPSRAGTGSSNDGTW